VVESLPSSEGRDQRYEHAMALVDDNDPLRVWIGYVTGTQASDASRLIAALTDRQYSACPVGVNVPAARVDLYARSPICCAPEADTTPAIRFGDGIALTGVNPLPTETTGTLPVLTGWSVDEMVQPYTYSVGLHVDNTNGDFVAQTDFGLPELRFSCSETLIPLDGLPPGEYRLYIVVYEWESGQRLQGEVPATNEQGERLLLGTFKIS